MNPDAVHERNTDSSSDSAAGNTPPGKRRDRPWLRRVVVTLVILLFVYMPGVLLGTVGSRSMHLNSLYDAEMFFWVVGVYGTGAAFLAFVAGYCFVALVSLQVALVRQGSLDNKSSFPVRTPIVWGLVAGALAASAAMLLTVMMFGGM